MLKEQIKTHIVPLACFAVLTYLLSLVTHFGYLANGSYQHDAGIFAYIGYAMENGRALYTEAWENKGPLLYLINMLAVSIDYYHGIYFVELISIFVSLLFAYKTALIIVKNNTWIAFFAAVFSISLFSVTLEGGNLSEEYAIVFMFVALYFVTKYFYNDFTLKIYEIVLVGMCLSAVFLLRANICAFFAVMIVVIAVALIRKRLWKELIKVSSLTLLGIILFLLPVLFYLISNNALGKCIDSAYLSILGNFSPLPKLTVFDNVRLMIAETIRPGIFYVAFVFMINYIICLINKLISNQSLKYMLTVSFWGLIANLFANSLSGAYHMHYFMTFIPIILIPSAWIFSLIYSFFEKNLNKETISAMATGAVVLFLSFNSIFIFAGQISDKIAKADQDYAAEYILNNSDSEDLVQVIGGNDVTLNYKTKRLTASRHVHFAAGRFSEEAKEMFANEISQDIKENHPKLIMFGSEQEYEDFKKAATQVNIEEILQNSYELQPVDFEYLVYKEKP